MSQKQPLRHLGLIMDGNRRWAKKQGLPTLEGHRRGYNKLKDVTQWCIEYGIEMLTVYAFSVENWQRSGREVNYLMNLTRQLFKKDIATFDHQGVRIKVIGQIERLAPDIQKLIIDSEAKTKRNQKLLLQIALSYGGRPEIVSAIKKIIGKKIKADTITEAMLGWQLWTAGVPDPDMIVRTSGEQRLSNFLTWQSVYAELYFIKKHWPDFTKRDIADIVAEYQQRQRRFGK